MGYSPLVRKESVTTERFTLSLALYRVQRQKLIIPASIPARDAPT